MAQAVVLTINNFPTGVDNTQKQQVLYGLVTFTGSGGYTTGDIATDWTKIVDPSGGYYQPDCAPGTSKPFLVNFTPLDATLNQYQWDAANNKLFAQTAGAQLASATVLSGVIAFEAHFGRGV